MNKIRNLFNNYLYNIISFFTGAIILLISFIKFGIYPFGNKVMLISDMYSQYIHYYISFYDTIKSFDIFSLLYSWKMGLGNNFIGLFAYYLSSPFNFIIFLFERKNITEAIFVITTLKISLSGLTFSLFLKYKYSNNKFTIVIFSVMYALMSYAITYSLDIMWLDALIYLPLIAIGIHKIIKENNFILYTIFLSLTIFSNFYISYMVCIFSTIYFINIWIVNYKSNEIRTFINKILLFISGSLISGALSAVLIVPTYFALKNAGSFAGVDLKTDLNFKFIDLLTKLLVKSYDTITTGLPNIYCGLLTTLLIILYFFNKKIKYKEKLSNGIIILIFLASFSISALNLIWHAFDIPAWFPYRYSFLLTFFLVDLAYFSFINIKSIRKANIFSFSIIFILIIFYIQKLGFKYINNNNIIMSIIFILLYTFLLYFISKETRYSKWKPILLTAIFVVISFEAYTNTAGILQGLNKEFHYSTKKDFNDIIKLRNTVSKLKEHSSEFYRVEKSKFFSYNDAMSMNYYGVSHYSSFAYNSLNQTLEKMGFCSNYNLAVNYSGSTKVTDALFGIKYLLTKNQEKTDYKNINMVDGYNVFFNDKYIPIGFVANKKIKNLTFNENAFEIQNNILNLSQGNTYKSKKYIDYFHLLDTSNIELKNAAKANDEEIYYQIDTSIPASIEFNFSVTSRQQLYCTINPKENLHVFVNDRLVDLTETYNNTIIDLGLHDGQTVKVKIRFNKDPLDLTNMNFYGLDIKLCNEALQNLKNSELDNLKVSSNSIIGNIKSSKSGILFTSIPYDSGWKAYINNKEVNTIKLGCFLAINTPSGNNNIQLKFMPNGFILGLIISIVGILLFTIVLIKNKRRKMIRAI